MNAQKVMFPFRFSAKKRECELVGSMQQKRILTKRSSVNKALQISWNNPSITECIFDSLDSHSLKYILTNLYFVYLSIYLFINPFSFF